MVRRGVETPYEVWEWIDHYLATVNRSPTAPDVRRAMDESAEIRALRPASDNTILKIIRRLQSGGLPWRLADVHQDGIEAELVLPVLGEIIERSDGGVRELGMNEARWITRIRRCAPDIPLEWAYYMARHYLVALARGDDTDGHDRFIAMRLWEDQTRREEAAKSGLVPSLGRYLFAKVHATMAFGTAFNASVRTD